MSKRLTMSNKMRRIFFGFLILLTGMAFAGCSNSSFESPETPQTGTGYFVLTNGTGADTETFRAQTITPTPAVNDFALYKLFFTGTGGNSNTQDVDRTPATLNNPVELPVGTWELEVFAYKTGSDDQPTAQGSFAGVIDIKNGGTTSGAVTLTLTTFALEDEGTFRWNISYPSDVSADMTITLLNGTPVQTASPANGVLSSPLTLNSGYYIVLVELTHDITGQTAKLREILHIYRDMESVFTHTFTASNFFATLSGVSVNIEVQMGVPANLLVATVTPAGTYNYQWYKNGSIVSGAANSATYTLAAGDESGSNSFLVTVTRDGYNGSVSSNPVTVNFCTVTFDGNSASGTAPTAQTVNSGSSVTLPNQGSLSKTGYSFDVWNTLNSGTGTDYSAGASYTPTGNITLYAQWTSKTVAITLDSNGGVNGSVTSISGKYDETIGSDLPSSSPKIPTRSDHIFIGWSTNSGTTNTENFYSSTEINEANGVVNAGTSPTLTLYAVWKIYIDMVPIPAGTFWMGSSDGTGTPGNPSPADGYSQEQPRHEVTLPQGFYMGKYQVTQDEYFAVMGTNPSYFNGELGPGSGYSYDRDTPPEETQGKRPVEYVSWYNAIVFCNKLSVMDGLTPAYSINGSTDPAVWGTVPTSSNDATWDAVSIVSGSTGYRLPTEAQWEYACRAGTTTAYNTNSDTIDDMTGWYSSNSNDMTHQVGLKAVNVFGLYDMHGNVWEWCWDWYDFNYYSSSPLSDPLGAVGGSSRMMRGGGWNGSASVVRSAYRNNLNGYPNDRYIHVGFRVVRP